MQRSGRLLPTAMTRRRYVWLLVATACLWTGALILIASLHADLQWRARILGWEASRTVAFLNAAGFFLLWAAIAPLWCWATVRRRRVLGLALWPARTLAWTGLAVVALCFVAAEILGIPPDAEGLDRLAPPSPDAAPEGAEHWWVRQMLLAELQSLTVMILGFLLMAAILVTTFSLRRDPPDLVETFR